MSMACFIATRWPPSSIEQIEGDHCDLLRAYNVEPQFASRINWCSVKQTSFNNGWAPTNGRFEGLREFCRGLAIVFPNTMPIEADFSVVGWKRMTTDGI